MRTKPAPDSQQARRLAAAGVTSCRQLADAVSAADAVLAAVPASSQLEVAERSASLLSKDCLYVDFASAPPAAKLGAAELVGATGARYVDAAVLGTVLTSGFAVPILASGPGAAAFEMLVAPDGLKVRAVDAPPGHAALVKLIRGVYLKGRDALVAEMMLTAKRYGVEERRGQHRRPRRGGAVPRARRACSVQSRPPRRTACRRARGDEPSRPRSWSRSGADACGRRHAARDL